MSEMKKTLLAVLVLLSYLNTAESIRVCKTFKDYNWPFSKNCWNNPDDSANVTEIIRGWGFQAQEYQVQTDDGYELLVVRCSNSTNSTDSTPILIGHGILMNGVVWTDLENKSMAYALGNLGYDVWLVNFRGSVYSHGHVNLSSDDTNYWKFGWHEIGIYDLRQTVDFIYKTTNKKAVYIGYSMGSTVSYVYTSTYPEESKEKLKGIISLAPAAYLQDLGLSQTVLMKLWPLLKPLINIFLNGALLRRTGLVVGVLRLLAKTTIGMYAGQTVIGLIFGFDYTLMDAVTYPVFLIQFLDALGVNVFTQYQQNFKASKFQQFDHGTTKNLELYGQSSPPSYNLSEIAVPVSFFAANNDPITTLSAVNRTWDDLSASVKCGYKIISDKIFAHLDFIQATNITELLYPDMIETIVKMDSGNC